VTIVVAWHVITSYKVLDLEDIFASDGPLAKQIEGYVPRVAQAEMAEAVNQAIETDEHLVAEAGTGTGKTFAYLIPAILSGKKLIVSTGTKNLQDQLFHKDIPLIKKVLDVPFNAVLLKGRSNYLCLYRLKNSMNSDLGFRKQEVTELIKINQWAGRTRSGDISEISGVSETSTIWGQITTTADNCLGQDCPDYSDCFLVQARRRAQEAKILVINHHLLCAEWSLRGGGFGELLPNVDVVIVDEAHHMAETASQFLGMALSARQMLDLAKDIEIEQVKDAPDMQSLKDLADELENRVRALRLTFGDSVRRGAWNEVLSRPMVIKALKELELHLKKLNTHLKEAAKRGKGLESCWRRCGDMENRLKSLLEEAGEQWIKWFETYKRTFVLNKTPMHVGDEFQQFLEEFGRTWIFTSATLTVSKQFDHFVAGLGLDGARTQCWESPFDYFTQALLYHPKNLPEPTSENFTGSVVEASIPVINASRGRTFFLFTSHKALQLAAKLLEDRIEYPLLVQGQQSKTRLIERFKTQGDAVLLGTSSFWEGVDVRGSALSCVIIDKFPFASPNDPVLKARLDSLRRQGHNPFASYQLPAAVIALKQGIGRLIRDITDRGVLMLCDPRLLTRGYGRVFLDSLPNMKKTRSIEVVQTFFYDQNENIGC